MAGSLTPMPDDARTEFEKHWEPIQNCVNYWDITRREHAKRAWNAALEAAAHVSEDNDHPYSARSTADRIRELKEPT